MPRLWDISPPISPATPAFPGDTTYQQRWNAEIGPGCPVNVSAITMSPHLGAHADAPLHYGKDAPAIGAVDLEPFIGRCRVIHAIGKTPLITKAHLEHVKHWASFGFDEIYVHNVGRNQEEFIEVYGEHVLPYVND